MILLLFVIVVITIIGCMGKESAPHQNSSPVNTHGREIELNGLSQADVFVVVDQFAKFIDLTDIQMQ